MSLPNANQIVQPGDIVRLHSNTGDYGTAIHPYSDGTAGKPIRYIAASDDKPVFRFGRKLSGWLRYSGTEGIDAVYKTNGSYSAWIVVDGGVLGSFPLGSYTTLWPRDTVTTRAISSTTNDLRKLNPGDSTINGHTVYVRLKESDNPNNHTLTALNRNGDTCVNVSERSHIYISGIECYFPERFINAVDSKYITIENSNFQHSVGYFSVDLRNSSYGVYRNNKFFGTGNMRGHKSDAIGVTYGANHILIENNEIAWTSHAAVRYRGASSYNIFRNNYLHDSWGTPMQIDAKDDKANCFRNVVEKNRFFGSLKKGALPLGHDTDHVALKVSCREAKVRFNKIWNTSGALLFTTQNGSYNIDTVVVHNTFYGNDAITNDSSGISAGYRGSPTVSGGHLVNNLVAYNTRGGTTPDFQLKFFGDSSPRIFVRIEGNDLYAPNANKVIKYGSTFGVAGFENQYPKITSNNIQVEPAITDYNKTNPDFRPLGDSPLIDRGVCLTTALNTGSQSNTLKVNNALYFIDGFGITGGDMIQIAKNNPVEIVNINYSTNTLTLAQKLVWNIGACVSFPYIGTKPDIGALEYVPPHGNSNLTRPRNLTLGLQ